MEAVRQIKVTVWTTRTGKETHAVLSVMEDGRDYFPNITDCGARISIRAKKGTAVTCTHCRAHYPGVDLIAESIHDLK